MWDEGEKDSLLCILTLHLHFYCFMAFFKTRYKYDFCNFENDKINILEDNCNSYHLLGTKIQSIMKIILRASPHATHERPAKGMHYIILQIKKRSFREVKHLLSGNRKRSCRSRFEHELSNGQANTLDRKRGWEYSVRRGGPGSRAGRGGLEYMDQWMFGRARETYRYKP